MAGIIERIFPVGSNLAILEELRGGSFSPTPSTFLIGAAQNIKTSLLMQAAVTEGSMGGQVLFVASSKLSRLPPSIHGMPTPSSTTMNNIRFLYANSTQEFQSYLASIHQQQKKDLPSMIIVDDLQKYSLLEDINDSPGQLARASWLLSLMQETAEYCSQRPHVSEEDSSRNSNNKNKDKNSSWCCRVLASWSTKPGDSLNGKDLENLGRDFCHQVWLLKHKPRSNGREYILSREFLSGASCIISFSEQLQNTNSHHLRLKQAELELPEETTNTHIDIKEEAKETHTDRKEEVKDNDQGISKISEDTLKLLKKYNIRLE